MVIGIIESRALHAQQLAGCVSVAFNTCIMVQIPSKPCQLCGPGLAPRYNAHSRGDLEESSAEKTKFRRASGAVVGSALARGIAQGFTILGAKGASTAASWSSSRRLASPSLMSESDSSLDSATNRRNACKLN